jgi:hypothetical protein
MADQHTYKFLPEDKCLSESQLFDYIDGKLKASDMHFIEKHILSCGFCSDALEGLEKVKHRDKVAAFIPSAANKEEKKEEPKVIPLNPNRKYYALAAGLVLILGITLFFRLSRSDEFAESKMADRGNADSISVITTPEKQPDLENGIVRSDSPSSSSVASGEADKRSANSDQTLKKALSTEGPPGYFDIAPSTDAQYSPAPKMADESIVLADKNTDGDVADDFVNIVDQKAAAEETVGADDTKDGSAARLEQQQVLAEKKNKLTNRSKDLDFKKAEKPQLAKEDMPVTLTNTSGGTPYSTNAPTNVPADNMTVPASTGTASGSVFTMTDSVMTTKSQSERELDLSYENANKMLASGQATASLALYDEVLKNPAHPHYQDAQWKKAEALIQLKRIEEAKKLLNEIAAKPGKYKELAKEKLKTL